MSELVDGRSMSEWTDELMACLRRSSEIYITKRLRAKPLLGGVFGADGFSICSIAYVERKLDQVGYLVRSDSTGFVVGSSEDMTEAISHARKILTLVDPFTIQRYMRDFAAWNEKRKEEAAQAAEADRQRRRDEIASAPSTVVRSIPRRRQRIFEESGGKCHYCSTALTLDGRWHIEHKMPKALGGDNEPGNLVASCAPCNHAKRDTTDVEFKAKRSKKVAA